jgi:predicted transcriptional regulator
MRYIVDMKTATIPSVRVEPELRVKMEQVLGEDESLSQFVENAVRDSVRRRIEQSEFVTRGLSSLAHARETGDYVEADEVVAGLRQKLAAAKARAARPGR